MKAAIADVKDSYSDCKKMLAVGEVANESLRRSLNCAKSECMGMVVESRDREYKLAESQMMIAELKKALSLSRSECVIAKTCTASSNTLLLQQRNHRIAGRERIVAWVAYIHIQERTHVKEAKLLNHRLILTCQQIIFLTDAIKKHKQIHLFT